MDGSRKGSDRPAQADPTRWVCLGCGARDCWDLKPVCYRCGLKRGAPKPMRPNQWRNGPPAARNGKPGSKEPDSEPVEPPEPPPPLSPSDSEIAELESVIKGLKALGDTAAATGYEQKLAEARQKRLLQKEVAPNTSTRNLSNKIDNVNKQVAAARKRVEAIDEEAAKFATQRAQAEETVASKTKLVADWEAQRHTLSSTVVSPNGGGEKTPELQSVLPTLLGLLADIPPEKRGTAKAEIATLQAACDASKAAFEAEQREKKGDPMDDAEGEEQAAKEQQDAQRAAAAKAEVEKAAERFRQGLRRRLRHYGC